MKSKLFSSKELSDSFKELLKSDFKPLLELSDEKINEGIGLIPQYLEADRQEQYNKIFEKFSSLADITEIEASHILSILHFFSVFMIDDEYKGDVQYWHNDLVEIDVIDNKNVEATKHLFSLFSDEILAKIKFTKIKNVYTKGVLPYFISCDTTFEDRYVIENEFVYGDSVEGYEPKILCKIPIISIHINTDEGNNDGFNFQASPEDVQNIINKLYATLLIINH
jgi:hypothetical protein